MRGSSSSLSSIQTSFSKFSADSIFSRRPSVSSQATNITASSFDSVPTLIKTPWEQERGRRGSAWKGRPRAPLPAHFFEQMPQTLYECFLRQLEAIHLADPAWKCATCYVTDLASLRLVSSAWNKAARAHMYRNVWVTADTNTHTTKKHRSGPPADRLKLLLRSLRADPQLAKGVKELHVADWLRVYEFAGSEERNDIVETLSAIVLACKNLERLVGFYTVYNHELDSLTHALSTRTRLKERLWIIRDDRALTTRQHLGDDFEEDVYEKPDYANSFVLRHFNWASLETLVLFGHNGRTGMDYRTFVGTVRKLQCLKTLSIATFPAEEFNDRTLQAMTAVHSLRLQALPGVTDKGLLKFLASGAATLIRRLSLIDIEITSLAVIAKAFSCCTQLRKFTFSQEACPSMPPGALLPHPFLSSKTLQYLHWDPLIPGPATGDLADCIESGAFPSLEVIRAPTDYAGKLQSRCKPVAQLTRDEDTHLISLLTASPVSDTHYTRNLSEARRAAQERLEAARQKPSLKIVIEEDGRVERVFTMRAFMGQLGSKIQYCLEPDVAGGKVAILGLADLISSNMDDRVDMMCTGPVNERETEGKKVWSHRPRRKGRGLDVKQLF